MSAARTLPPRVLGAVILAGALVVPATVAAQPSLDPPLEEVTGAVEPLGTDSSARPAAGVPAPASAQTAAGEGQQLVGLFGVTDGSCDGRTVSGSYFRMVNPGGNPDSGPFVGNGDSPCGDNTYTPLRAGSDGGLSTTGYQPHPEPPFQGGGGRNDKIIQPAPFFGVPFAAATEERDRQTSTDVPVPAITFDCAGGLTGDVRAYAAAWNGQHFNQGAPKPDGSRPEGTTGPEGTYDPSARAYTLIWTSRIVGGPFNNFTGVWHLEGTFQGEVRGSCPAGGAPAANPAVSAPAAESASTVARSPGAAAQSASGSQGRTPNTGGGAALPVIGLALTGAAVALRRRTGGAT